MERLNESFTRSIFATDAVGFSKLVSQREYETLAALKECLEIIAQILHSHGGRIFHSAGHSVLAEFTNSKDAFATASLVQERLNEQNLKTQLQKLKFRIGLDIGEVFADGECASIIVWKSMNAFIEVLNREVRLIDILRPHIEPYDDGEDFHAFSGPSVDLSNFD